MNEISKKDLLILTGISYGQLYRWKRKGLIPEEWFVKKASFTGQETFFPKDLILERIDRILELKEDVSLEDLSDLMKDREQTKSFYKEALFQKEILRHRNVWELESKDPLDFDQIVLLKFIDNFYEETHSFSMIKDLYAFLIKNKEILLTKTQTIYFLMCENKLQAVFTNDSPLEYGLSKPLIKQDVKVLIDNLKLILFV